MGIKKLLGLEDCELSPSEIMRKIEEAHRNHQEEVVFVCRNGSKVKLKMSKLAAINLTDDYSDYFTK